MAGTTTTLARAGCPRIPRIATSRTTIPQRNLHPNRPSSPSQILRRGSTTTCMAKKKGGKGAKKKGAKRKESKFSQLAKGPPKHESTEVIMDLLMLVESHARLLGRPLLPDAGEIEITSIASVLYEAPFVLLSHRVRDGEPPRWCYANKAALALFETEWDAFIGELSSECAPPTDESQDERNAYLAKAMEDGSVEGIEAVRVSAKGTRFTIKDVTLWNVGPGGEDAAITGQAACFAAWEYEDGTEGNVGTLFGEGEGEGEGEGKGEGKGDGEGEGGDPPATPAEPGSGGAVATAAASEPGE